MARFAQRAHPLRGEADAEFVVFYFPGDADTHVIFLMKYSH